MRESILIVLLVCGVSFASTLGVVDLKHNGYGGYDEVRIRNMNPSTGIYATFNGPAGIYIFDKSGDAGLGNHWADGSKTVFGLCMDLYQRAPEGVYGTYDINPPMLGPDPYGPMWIGKESYLRELWARYFNPSWAHLDNQINPSAAAFDVAIWEIIYEDLPASAADYNVAEGNGKFYVKTGSGTVHYDEIVSTANNWLNSLTGGQNAPQAYLTALTSPEYQDMLVEITPEPTTMIFLLLAGLTGFIKKR